MPWLWETTNDVKKQCEKDRIKKANEAERNVRINVENHKNSGVAQLHLEKMSMEGQKQAEIDEMREVTQRTLEDLNESHYKTKRTLAEKSSKEKTKILNEHEAKIKEKEQERDKAAREQSQRTEGLRKDQDETINKVEELKKENLREQIKEIGKTSELQSEIFDAEKKLSEKHDREFHETEKQAYEDKLQVEKNFNAMTDEDSLMTYRSIQQVHDLTIAMQSDNLSLRVHQSLSDDIGAVDEEISRLKALADQIKNGLDASSIVLKALTGKNDKNERTQASNYLKKVQIDLSHLTKNVTLLERKAKKIVDQSIQTELQEAFTKIRKKTNATSEPITDVISEMRSTKEFDQAKQKKLVKSVMSVIKLVGDLRQLDTGEKDMKINIQKSNKELSKQHNAIENATEEE